MPNCMMASSCYCPVLVGAGSWGAAGQDDIEVTQTVDRARDSTIVGYDSRTDIPKS
jgi:hypothetical protein